MGITALVFVLIILLFGLDSTGQVKTRQQRSWLGRVYSRSHDAVIRVYDDAGSVIERHEHKGDFKQ